MKTCLVIDARKVSALYRDGPAIRIGLTHQSSRLFPLRRLARVHILGALQDGFDALIYCAEHQVPVAFFTLQGKLRCQLYHPIGEQTTLSHWLDNIQFDSQLMELYQEWRFHQMLNTLSQLGFRDGSGEKRLQRAEQKLRNIVLKHLGNTQMKAALEWLGGMLQAHLAQLFSNYGLATNSRKSRCLMQDMQPLCELWLLYFLAMRVTRQTRLSITGASMSLLYQQSAEHLEYNIERMLYQLVTRFESVI